jgi:hypothetical protein
MGVLGGRFFFPLVFISNHLGSVVKFAIENLLMFYNLTYCYSSSNIAEVWRNERI